LLSCLEIEHRIFFLRVGDAIKPIFPGYVFVNVDNFDFMRTISNILGFVRTDGQAVNVAHVVEQLDRESRGSNILPHTIRPRFKEGDLVQVQAIGHVAFSRVGKFQRYMDSNRAVVLMAWFDRFVPTVLDQRDLEHARHNPRRCRRKRVRRRAVEQRSGNTSSNAGVLRNGRSTW
jgi:transcription antitermination factor NusG